VGGDRGAGALGGVSRGAELGPGPVPGELRRVGVEAEANLTAALVYERRKSIRELGQCRLRSASEPQLPLTLLFSAEPAEKRGTLPPGIVIRSPVRGLTP